MDMKWSDNGIKNLNHSQSPFSHVLIQTLLTCVRAVTLETKLCLKKWNYLKTGEKLYTSSQQPRPFFLACVEISRVVQELARKFSDRFSCVLYVEQDQDAAAGDIQFPLHTHVSCWQEEEEGCLMCTYGLLLLFYSHHLGSEGMQGLGS